MCSKQTDDMGGDGHRCCCLKTIIQRVYRATWGQDAKLRGAFDEFKRGIDD